MEEKDLLFERIKVVTPAEEKKSGDRLWIVKTVLFCIIVFLVCLFILNTFIQRTDVSGNSMNPTLSDGDQVLVNKFAYKFSAPERYDIIVFSYNRGDNVNYIKRIVGLPGETVQIKDGYVYINGEKLEDDAFSADVMSYAGIAEEPLTLGENEYFVLGDNRNASSDSRYSDVGVVNKDQITGKAWFRSYPVSSMGTIK